MSAEAVVTEKETYDPKTRVRTVEVWVGDLLVETIQTLERTVVITGPIRDE